MTNLVIGYLAEVIMSTIEEKKGAPQQGEEGKKESMSIRPTWMPLPSPSPVMEGWLKL